MLGCEEAAAQSTFPQSAHTPGPSRSSDHTSTTLHSLHLPSPRSPYLVSPGTPEASARQRPPPPAPYLVPTRAGGGRSCIGLAQTARRPPRGARSSTPPSCARRGPRPPPVAKETLSTLFVTPDLKGLGLWPGPNHLSHQSLKNTSLPLAHTPIPSPRIGLKDIPRMPRFLKLSLLSPSSKVCGY